MTRGFRRTICTAAAFLLAWSANLFIANAATVTSVADTGLFNPDEMTIDDTNGDIFLTGFADGATELSIVKVSGGSVTPLYGPLPGTQGNLT